MTKSAKQSAAKKLFKVDFDPIYPVPSGLVILAVDEWEAEEIASDTIKHTKHFTIDEVDMTTSGVVFYESGDY